MIQRNGNKERPKVWKAETFNKYAVAHHHTEFMNVCCLLNRVMHVWLCQLKSKEAVNWEWEDICKVVAQYTGEEMWKFNEHRCKLTAMMWNRKNLG